MIPLNQLIIDEVQRLRLGCLTGKLGQFPKKKSDDRFQVFEGSPVK